MDLDVRRAEGGEDRRPAPAGPGPGGRRGRGKAPYTLDVGAAAKSGSNTIEVRIANLWVNRLIGDQQPGATKVAFVTIPTYHVDAPLRPSGLIGPVTLSVRAD